MAKTVLIVEDNELNMKLFHDLLEAHGYQIVGTRNGIEALDLARKHRPDLIIMDIQLPEVSGLEVTKWLKDDPELKSIPVVAVTAFAMKGDEERIREGGCEAYLSKPISVGKFIETVRHFLGAGGEAMTARILVVDDIPANVKLLEARLTAEYFDVSRRTRGARGARDLRARAVRHRAARRDDAGDGRLRGLPPAQGQSGDASHSGRDGDGARPAVRPRARARSRRGRFPDQAGVRHRAARARALAGAPEDGGGRTAHARGHVARDRHQRSGSRGAGRDRPQRPRAAGRRPQVVLRAHRRDPDRRAHGRRRAEPAGSAVPCGRGRLRVHDRLARAGEFRRAAAVQPGALARAHARRADPDDRRGRGQRAAAARARDRRERLSGASDRQERAAGARAHADPPHAATRCGCATTCSNRWRWRSPTA